MSLTPQCPYLRRRGRGVEVGDMRVKNLSKIEPQEHKCPKCKRKINVHWYYCPMCGEKLKEGENE